MSRYVEPLPNSKPNKQHWNKSPYERLDQQLKFDEAAAIECIALIGSLYPNQNISEHTPAAWVMLLDDIDARDVLEGVKEVLRTSNYWPKPAEVREAAKRESSRREFMERAEVIEVPTQYKTVSDEEQARINAAGIAKCRAILAQKREERQARERAGEKCGVTLMSSGDLESSLKNMSGL